MASDATSTAAFAATSTVTYAVTSATRPATTPLTSTTDTTSSTHDTTHVTSNITHIATPVASHDASATDTTLIDYLAKSFNTLISRETPISFKLYDPKMQRSIKNYPFMNGHRYGEQDPVTLATFIETIIWVGGNVIR